MESSGSLWESRPPLWPFSSCFPLSWTNREREIYSLERTVSHIFMTTDGIFGIPLGVSATFVALFILFSSFLDESGAGNLFLGTDRLPYFHDYGWNLRDPSGSLGHLCGPFHPVFLFPGRIGSGKFFHC